MRSFLASKEITGNFLWSWLRFHASNVSQGTKIPHAMQHGQIFFFLMQTGNSLVVQWSGLDTVTDVALGSIPGSTHGAAQPGKNKNQKK